VELIRLRTVGGVANWARLDLDPVQDDRRDADAFRREFVESSCHSRHRLGDCPAQDRVP
jgi:hypothetical protein